MVPLGQMHCAVLLIFSFVPASAADSALRFNRVFGGSGSDNASAIAVDPSGNVIVAGSTSSYDFPVTNGSMNAATHFGVSADAGGIWHPLGNLPAGSPWTLAVDTSTPPVWYAGGTQGIFKSTDGGATWTSLGPAGPAACNYVAPFCGVTQLAINPVQPSTIYAIADGGIWKTVDDGATWTALPRPSSNPNSASYLVLDPFQPDHVFISVGQTDFRSFDGGQTWTQFTPPLIDTTDSCASSLAFDAVTPGVVYIADRCNLFRSVDGGIYWTQITGPFHFAQFVTTGPAKSGLLFITANEGLLESKDGAQTWKALLPAPIYRPAIVVDPNDPSNLISGTLRSGDGGATWSPLAIGRDASAIVFDPQTPGRVLCATAGAGTSFLAKLDATGAILAATYFGGQGTTSISGVTTDAGGNVYVTGSTTSPDFPAPPVEGASAFVARFDSSLTLAWATLLAGVAIRGNIAVDANGSAAVTGATAISNTTISCFVTKLTPDGSGVVFSKRFGGTRGDACNFVAEDSQANTVVAGTTWSYDFPVAGAGTGTSLNGYNDAVVAKFDPSGALLFSEYLGGGDADTASAVGVDAAGNIYVSGTTASKDFPTTAGAYQTALRAHCGYPSSVVNTGLIGTIFEYQTDDAFVTKLDPAGNLVFSTYLGADCYDMAQAMAVDASGNVWIAGSTNSDPFPQTTPFASGPAYAYYQPFLSELDASGSTLLFSSYAAAGSVGSIAVDPDGSVYLGGATTQPQSVYGGIPAPPTVSSGVHASLAKVQPQAAGAVSIRSVGNAFTLRDGPVSPGQITRIAADGIAPASAINLTLRPWAPLPRSLADTQVLFDGEAAAIVSVAAGEVVVVAPYDLAGKTQSAVQVVFQGNASSPMLADIQADTGYLSVDGTGTGQAYARNPDGSLNSPQNPAPRGASITVYLTGLGAVDAACPEGGVAPPAGTPLPLPGSSAPGFLCGIFQTTVRTPTYGPNPNVPLPNSAVTYSVQLRSRVQSAGREAYDTAALWTDWCASVHWPRACNPKGRRDEPASPSQEIKQNELGPITG